jgi:predicted esterase
LNTLIQGTESAAASGLIDPPDNMAGQPVFLFSGSNDRTVVPNVMRKLESYYSHYGLNITNEITTTNAGHHYPTENYVSSSSVPNFFFHS